MCKFESGRSIRVQHGFKSDRLLGHCSTENPFNLADDFIEPYRFVVERYVAQSEPGEFDGKARKQLLQLVETEVLLNNAGYRLPAAITETVASYLRILDGRKGSLALPADALFPKAAWA